MPTFKTSATFTAQIRLVSALHHLYNVIERTPKHPADLLPVAVFMAFSIESYVNQLGSSHVKFWEDFERKLSWKEKIELLHKNRGKKPTWGKEPLQFASEIFKLRDRLAHGKPEEVTGSEFSSHQEAEEFILNNDLEPEWFKKINAEWLDQSKGVGYKSQGRFVALMEYLATLHDLSPTNYYQESSKYVVHCPE